MSETILDTYVRLHPQSAALYEESLRVFPSGVTHDVRYVTPFPIFVERAEAAHKYDVDGNELVDFVMGHGALFMGHAHPDVTAAIVEQAKKGTHFGANHRLELAWGRRVKELVPCAEEVRFTSSGTEATLMAIRLARAHTGRDRLLKFDHHFHGWHDAVVGSREPEAENPESAGVPSATMSNTVSIPQGDIDAVEERLATGEFATLILEPTGAGWGSLPLDPAFLSALRTATTRHNTVLIFDEVVTGFRVSPGGTQARYGVTPDLTTLAKILAGGMPGGAVCGRGDIISMIEFRDSPWNARKRVQHPGTFNANPVSAAAGDAMLAMVATEEHHARANALNERLVRELNGVLERTGVPGVVYGLASYFHIALGREAPRPQAGIEWPGPEAPPSMPGKLNVALKRALINHGVDLMGGSGGFVSGVHTDADIDHAIKAFEAAVSELRAEHLV
ncbi:MAG: aminotransferase class III-fold pyridoxal phosphate-dependent enzyme [Chloroflexi bacterium]|nr:aminotransferase class III-fold pyridoxal phosphate-dependent enzyme [Chloroflexota bacterium]